MLDLHCDVCRIVVPFGVVTSGLVPYSYAVCEECIRHHAKPAWIVDHMLEMAGNDIYFMVPEFRHFIYTFHEGRYISAFNFWMKKR